jgi:hypothetical protein
VNLVCGTNWFAMDTQLREDVGRPRRYDDNDGTGEMVFGLMALGFTLVDYVQTALPGGSVWRRGVPSMVLLFGIVGLMVGAIHWVPRVIKTHITWPRTGYAVPRVLERKSFWVVMAGSAVVAASVAGGLGYLMRSGGAGGTGEAVEGGRDWMSVVWVVSAGMYVAGYAWFTYLWGRDYPWKWAVLGLMVLGVVGIGLVTSAGLAGARRPMLLFVGLMWLASGVGTLWAYVLHTEVPARGEE